MGIKGTYSYPLAWMIPGIMYMLMVVPALPVHAQDYPPPDTSTITLFIENDITDRTDWWYTSGIKLTWISPDLLKSDNKGIVFKWADSCIDRIPFINEPGLLRTFSVSFGQSIYTPENRLAKEPIKDDRPYAGISYLALGFHGRNAWKMDTLEFDIGMVGPHSYAEQTQKIVHKLTGYYEPQGWDNQLHDEPIFNIYFDRKWKLIKGPLNDALEYDIIPYAGINLGNALTSANAGSEIRLGWYIPNDYGTFLIRPGSDSNAPLDKDDPRYSPSHHNPGAYLFAGIDTNAVLRNILLDGNTFKDSLGVEKEPFVANLFAGFGVTYQRVKLTFAQVYRTKEFKNQDTGEVFGSLTLSYSF
jgi:hypothetical protein